LGARGEARLWETATGKPLGPPLQHQAVVSAVAFSRNGETVLTGSSNTVRLWDTASGKSVGPPLQHKRFVYALAAEMGFSDSWSMITAAYP